MEQQGKKAEKETRKQTRKTNQKDERKEPHTIEAYDRRIAGP